MNPAASYPDLAPHAPATAGRIVLTDAGKRFNREWIFRHFNYEFQAGNGYAITGANGSGKSTLLQAIAGSLHLNEGELEFHMPGTSAVLPENCYEYISIVAPYLELIEEMNAIEFLQFHQKFKPLVEGITIAEILNIIGLGSAAQKQIRYFSSGMKQRIKLAQAIFAAVPVLLLDEPCTNLDAPGYELYHLLIDRYCRQKLVIVSSNDAAEMDFCQTRIPVSDFK